MASEERKAENPPEIDLKEVEMLLEALERDLKKVQGGARDVQVLRDEVETLKNVLNSPVRRHHWVRDGLHAIRENFENVARIGPAQAALWVTSTVAANGEVRAPV